MFIGWIAFFTRGVTARHGHSLLWLPCRYGLGKGAGTASGGPWRRR